MLDTTAAPDASVMATAHPYLSTIASIVAAVVALLARRTASTAVRHIHDLHVIVNSRLDLLLEQTRRAAHAEGLIEGRAAAAAGLLSPVPALPDPPAPGPPP